MPSASSTPTTLGLYINSFKKGSNTDPYTQLLGTDGYGNYSLGNKIDALGNYIAQYGYNYGLFYGLSDSVSNGGCFTNTVTSETFLTGTGVGADILNNVLPRFHNDYGVTLRAAILDVAQPQMIAVGNTYSSTDGISQIKKIINWNQSVSYAADKIFNWMNIETEFWNFAYDDATTLPGNVVALNAVNAGFNRGELRASPGGSFVLTGLGVGVNDFICLNNQWRQVISVSSNLIIVDRPWNTTGIPGTWKFLNFDGTVDYETFLYRMQKACQYIQDFGSGELVDIYVGIPSYTFKGTLPAGYPRQLAKLYQAGVTRINLTAYQKTPSFDTGYFDSPLNGNYASAPSGGYKKVSDDIVSDATLRNLGVILSVESATFNNSSCPTNNTDNNFSGYIMEGRSVLPHNASTNFRALDSGGLTIPCVCCATPISKPDVTFNPLSIDEIWQYVAEVPPSGGICPACYPPALGNTFNELITAGGTLGTNLDSYIDFDTLIVFDQEFMRQLNITPEIDFTLNITKSDVTCFGLHDGLATVDITGGVAPFTFQWQIYDTGTASWIDYFGPGATTDQIINVHGTFDYRCIVTDDAATSVTSAAVTVIQPAVIDFTVVSTTANCAGTGGSISITGVTGGTTPYLYSIVPTGSTKVWTGASSRNGLVTGTYDVSVASGNPANGCFITKTGTVGTGSSFTITATQGNASCYLGTGSLITTPSVAGTYTYNLYDSSPALIQSNSSGVFNSLTAGVYTIQATNSLGCSSNILSKTITQPTEVTGSAVGTNPTCYLGTDGQIVITAGGGTPGYTYYLIFPSGNTITNGTNTFTGLAPMTYEYYTVDSAGCQSEFNSITIDNPSAINPIYTVTQIPQGEVIGGAITLVNISGGTGPYTYLWSNSATTASITGLVPGEYTVDIEDDNGCTVRLTFNIRVECTNLSYDAYKVQIYKAQCCAGDLAKKFVKLAKQGNKKESKKVMHNLTILTLILRSIRCNDNPGDEVCFECEDMILLLENIKNICSCDCCEEEGKETVNVSFDSDTNQLNII